MFDILEADIVIMQETKIQRKDLRDDMVLVPGWDVYFSLPKHKKGGILTLKAVRDQIAHSITQDTLESLYTPVQASALQSEQKLESQAYSVPQTARQASSNFRKTNRLADTRAYHNMENLQ
jgi:AP endonuclease-2